jgi:hypothetical protein
MKLGMPAVVCAAILCHGQSFAGQTVDCQIEKSDYFVLVGSSLRMSPDAQLQLAVQGTLRNGEQVSYAKDEPVIVADVRILRTTPVFVPSTAMVLKKEGLFGHKLHLPPGRTLGALQEIALPDGRVFSIIPVTEDHAVVAKRNGELCNVAIAYRVPDPYWLLDMTVEPADAALEAKVQEQVADRAGVRIIFNGVSAGQLSFQEVWVSGSTIRSSVVRAFDQFAKSVRVGFFDFEVVEVSSGKVTLRYEIQERGPVKAADVTKAGLRSGEFAGAMVVRPRR